MIGKSSVSHVLSRFMVLPILSIENLRLVIIRLSILKYKVWKFAFSLFLVFKTGP